jgi:hypothetical protein
MVKRAFDRGRGDLNAPSSLSLRRFLEDSPSSEPRCFLRFFFFLRDDDSSSSTMNPESERAREMRVSGGSESVGDVRSAVTARDRLQSSVQYTAGYTALQDKPAPPSPLLQVPNKESCSSRGRRGVQQEESPVVALYSWRVAKAQLPPLCGSPLVRVTRCPSSELPPCPLAPTVLMPYSSPCETTHLS